MSIRPSGARPSVRPPVRKMSRRAVRPRPIDKYRKLPVVQTERLEFTEHDGTKVRIEHAGHLQNDPNAGHNVNSQKRIDIPTPIVHTVQDYKHEVSGGYKPPRHFIKNKPMFYNDKPDLDDPEKMDYSMDYRDMQWLSKHRLYGENGDPRYRITNVLFEKIIYLLEFECDLQNKVINEQEAQDCLVKHLGLVRSPCIEIYRYWLNKRTLNQKPLLRRFWPVTATGDINPHMVFRPRDELSIRGRLRRNRKNDASAYEKLQAIKADFERLRVVLLNVKKREQLKLSLLEYNKELFEQQMFDKTDSVGTLRKPKILDMRSEMFLEPKRSASSASGTSSNGNDMSLVGMNSTKAARRAGGEEDGKADGKLNSAVGRRRNVTMTTLQMRAMLRAAGPRGSKELLSVVQRAPALIPNAAVFGIKSVLQAPKRAGESFRSGRTPSYSDLSYGGGIVVDENDKIGLAPYDKTATDGGKPFIPSYMHQAGDLPYSRHRPKISTETPVPVYPPPPDQKLWEESGFAEDEMYRYRGRVGRHGRIWIDNVLATREERKISELVPPGEEEWNGKRPAPFLRPEFHAPPHPLASGGKFIDDGKVFEDQLASVEIEPSQKTPLEIEDAMKKIYAESDSEDEDVVPYGPDNEKPYRQLQFAMHF